MIPVVFAITSFMSAPLSGISCCINSIAIPKTIVTLATSIYIRKLFSGVKRPDKYNALKTSQANTPKIIT